VENFFYVFRVQLSLSFSIPVGAVQTGGAVVCVQTCGAVACVPCATGLHTGLQCLPLNVDLHMLSGQAQGTAATDGYLNS
jgi:hypothetical protein